MRTVLEGERTDDVPADASNVDTAHFNPAVALTGLWVSEELNKLSVGHGSLTYVRNKFGIMG